MSFYKIAITIIIFAGVQFQEYGAHASYYAGNEDTITRSTDEWMQPERKKIACQDSAGRISVVTAGSPVFCEGQLVLDYERMAYTLYGYDSPRIDMVRQYPVLEVMKKNRVTTKEFLQFCYTYHPGEILMGGEIRLYSDNLGELTSQGQKLKDSLFECAKSAVAHYPGPLSDDIKITVNLDWSIICRWSHFHLLFAKKIAPEIRSVFISIQSLKRS